MHRPCAQNKMTDGSERAANLGAIDKASLEEVGKLAPGQKEPDEGVVRRARVDTVDQADEGEDEKRDERPEFGHHARSSAVRQSVKRPQRDERQGHEVGHGNETEAGVHGEVGEPRADQHRWHEPPGTADEADAEHQGDDGDGRKKSALGDGVPHDGGRDHAQTGRQPCAGVD